MSNAVRGAFDAPRPAPPAHPRVAVRLGARPRSRLPPKGGRPKPIGFYYVFFPPLFEMFSISLPVAAICHAVRGGVEPPRPAPPTQPPQKGRLPWSVPSPSLFFVPPPVGWCPPSCGVGVSPLWGGGGVPPVGWGWCPPCGVGGVSPLFVGGWRCLVLRGSGRVGGVRGASAARKRPAPRPRAPCRWPWGGFCLCRTGRCALRGATRFGSCAWPLAATAARKAAIGHAHAPVRWRSGNGRLCLWFRSACARSAQGIKKGRSRGSSLSVNPFARGTW